MLNQEIQLKEPIRIARYKKIQQLILAHVSMAISNRETWKESKTPRLFKVEAAEKDSRNPEQLRNETDEI